MYSWKKSCTSWYGKYLIIYKVLYIPGGDRRISAINSISRSNQFPTWLPSIPRWPPRYATFFQQNTLQDTTELGLKQEQTIQINGKSGLALF